MSESTIYAVGEEDPTKQVDKDVTLFGVTTSSSETDVVPAMRMTVGPAALDAGDYAQAWINVADGQTFELLAWGLIDSDENSPNDIELTLMNSGTEVYSNSGVVWEEPGDPIATVDGPANVYIQLINNSSENFDPSDDTTRNWAASNFEYRVD